MRVTLLWNNIYNCLKKNPFELIPKSQLQVTFLEFVLCLDEQRFAFSYWLCRSRVALIVNFKLTCKINLNGNSASIKECNGSVNTVSA